MPVHVLQLLGEGVRLAARIALVLLVPAAIVSGLYWAFGNDPLLWMAQLHKLWVATGVAETAYFRFGLLAVIVLLPIFLVAVNWTWSTATKE